MKSQSLPGRFDAFRRERALLRNELDAIHGGGAARFTLFFNTQKIYRDIVPSISDVFGHYRYGKLPLSFQIWTTRGTGLVSSFDAVRTVCQLELWNHFSLRLFLQNRYCWLPQDVFDDSGGEQQQEGEYALALSCNYDLKGRYFNPHRGFFDSFFAGTQSAYPCRFSLSKGTQKARLLSSFDSFRIWTPDVYQFLHDKNYGAVDLHLGRLDAVLDAEQWPIRFVDRASNLISNSLSFRGRYLFKRDQKDILPWKRWLYRYDAFLYYFDEYPLHRQAFVRPGWKIMATNLETSEIIELGFIDADHPSRTLENISLPDGDYEISVLTSSLFWKDAMDGNKRTISVRPGEEVSSLPVIYNLRSGVADGATTVYWSASKSEIDECLFGIWYSPEPFFEQAPNGSDSSARSGSSECLNGRLPDATVWYSSSMTEYQTSFAQNAPAWVAVAAMRLDEENQIGKVHELFLNWSNIPPRAPDDVVVLAAPLSAIDSEIYERPLEDEDLAIVF